MDSCPLSEKRPRRDDITSMQAARRSVIRFANSNTRSLDQPGVSMQPGKKFESASSDQDGGNTPLHALPGTPDVQVQPELVNVYIFFFLFRIFSKIRQIFSTT